MNNIKNYVDRENEVNKIKQRLIDENYKCMLVYASSGIGKSALSAKVAYKLDKKFDLIFKVSTPPKNSTKNLSEGFYIKELCKSLMKHDLKDVSFLDYIGTNGKMIHKLYVSNELDYINSEVKIKGFLGKTILKFFVKRIAHLKEYDINYYINSEKAISLNILSSYLEYVFRRKNVLVIIDNVQNIDNYSQEKFFEMMDNNDLKAKFLLEYTTIYNNDEYLDFYIAAQKFNFKIDIMSLNALSPQYAIETLNKKLIKDNNIINSIADYYLSYSNGSIQKLMDYVFQYNKFKDEVSLEKDPTLGKLNDLKKDAFIVLSIIILHDGRIHADVLNDIIRSDPKHYYLNVENELNILCNKFLLIKISNKVIELEHASIADSWEVSPKFGVYKITAYQTCQIYYENLLAANDNDLSDSIIYMLMKIYIVIDNDKIISLLQNIHDKLNTTILPKQIRIYLQTYLSTFFERGIFNYNILCYLIKFTFDFGLYEDCLYIISKIKGIAPKQMELFMNVYIVNCKEYLGLHKDTCALCEEQLGHKDISDKEKYNYYLLLLGCYRSLNKGQEFYDSLKKKIINIKDYESYYPEYGIFLRLAEIYESHINAIIPLQNSIAFFEGKDLMQELKSRIIYSFLLVSKGDYSAALSEYEICDKKTNKCSQLKNIIAMNKASMHLRNDEISDIVEELLNYASLSITGTYDTLLLLNIKLAYYATTKQFDKTPGIVSRIEHYISTETDKLLLAASHYNLFLYYNLKGEVDSAKENFDKSELYRAHNSFVNKALNKTNTFIPQKSSDWSLGITFHWNVDMDY